MLFAWLSTGCLDQIDLRQGDPLTDGIALSGRMWVEGTEASVLFRAGRLFRFNSNRSERIINADITVELSDGTGHPLAYNIEENIFEARFSLEQPLQDSLRARIRVVTNEGDDYLSDWDPVPEEIIPDTLIPSQVFNDEGEPVSIVYNLQTPARRSDGSGVPFLYRFSRSYRALRISEPIRYCYYLDSLRQTQITLIEPKANYSGDLRTIEIYTDEIDWRYAEGHYLNITQDPISDAAYEYFSNFLGFQDRDRSIFEAPPGNLPGNFRSLTDPEQERICGLFYVTRPRIIRAGIPEGGVDVEAFCIPIGNFNHPRCGDCARAGGGGRPSYWAF